MRKIGIYQLHHCKKSKKFQNEFKSPRNFLIVKLIFKKLFIMFDYLTDGNFRCVDRSRWMVCIIEIILYNKIRFVFEPLYNFCRGLV